MQKRHCHNLGLGLLLGVNTHVALVVSFAASQREAGCKCIEELEALRGWLAAGHPSAGRNRGVPPQQVSPLPEIISKPPDRSANLQQLKR